MGFLLTASGGTEHYRIGSPGIVSSRVRALKEREEGRGWGRRACHLPQILSSFVQEKARFWFVLLTMKAGPLSCAN